MKFFLKHPVIAVVLNIMIVIVGYLSMTNVTLREYPKIQIPVLTVISQYPNASPELIESSVTNILEDQLAGLEGLETMLSNSRQDSSSIELTFVEGTSVDLALTNIRDAIGSAKQFLPKDLLDPRIEKKTQADWPPFIAISLVSDTFEFGALTHFANLYLKNAFRSIKGVASVNIWGQSYTMEVNLDAKKMYAFGVNASDIVDAIEKYNVALPVGKYRNATSTTLDIKLKTPRDFERLFIKQNKEHPIYLESVADIALKIDANQPRGRINGKPGLMMVISHANDANPLDVSRDVHNQLKSMQLPGDIKAEVIIDQTDFIKSSLKNVKSSIYEAIFLVLVIVFLFLRSLRATIIPLITIPISLIGSIIFIKLFGYSINTITMLAMVLAIGLVVDDAIIVMENIDRHIEEGLDSYNAAIKGIKEIGFAIIAMTLTLASVYAPIAFIKGMMGQLFVEFAVALAGSVLISGVVALTLSPVMCAKILKPHQKKMLPIIDIYLNKIELFYQKILKAALGKTKQVLIASFGILFCSYLLFNMIPKEIVPKEDRGMMGLYAPSIAGKNFDYMEQYMDLILTELGSIPEGNGHIGFIGEWGAGSALMLKPHSKRKRTAAKIVQDIRPKMMAIPSVDIWPWSADSGLPGLDDALTSSELMLAITTIGSYRDLYNYMNELRKKIEEKNIFESVRVDLKMDNPGYVIDLDHHVIALLEINPNQIAKTIEVFFSDYHYLMFEKDTIRYAITIKGNDRPWTLDELYFTTNKDKRVSIGTFATLTPTSSPKALNHYNQMRAGFLIATMKPNQKIETAMPALWEMVKDNKEYKKEWMGAAKAYLQSSSTMAFLFLMALVFIYAILTVQFENFLDPFIIMLTVPLACFGALFIAWLFGQSLNVYTQIGLVTLIGLITKHGILIVEFSNQLVAKGLSASDAVVKACILRLRPILMTTAAMVFGALPLILSGGAGAEARSAIGYVLIGGLSFGTIFTLIILPKFYLLLKR